MPAATQYWANDDQQDSALIDAAEFERRQRAELHEKGWRYYDGDHPRHLKVKQNPKTGAVVDNNVTINLVAQAVDRTVAFLFPAMPRLELVEDVETKAEKWLRAAWEHNNDVIMLSNMATNGCLDGHVYAKVLTGSRYPRLVNLNSANVIVFWQADDVDTVLWYETRWKVGNREYREDTVNLTVLGMGAGWQIREYVRDAKSGSQNRAEKWTLMRETAWAYPLGPIVDWQHLPAPNRFYGKPDLGHELRLTTLNDAVNKTASDYKAILRTHAAPRTIGTGIRTEDMKETAIDQFWAIPNPDAKVFNVEMQSDLDSSMEFIKFLVEAFYSQARITIAKGGPEAFKDVTNLGIKVAYLDMLAKDASLRRQYGRGIREISRRFLMLGGFPHDIDIIERWPEPLPTSEPERVEIVAKEQALGLISRESAAGALGLDWDLEQARMEREKPSPPTPLPQGEGES
jgi:hypothetical protein